MPNELREQAAARYEQAAKELEEASQHLHVTARHFRNDDVAAGCSHAWAAFGHMHNANDLLKALAVLHASRALLPQ